MTRVLHADDDPQVAAIVRLLFEQFPKEFEIEHVESGRACLTAMQHGKFDLLLLDLVMPDIDGLHVLGELAARGDPTPVVMVSGQGQHELAVRALRAGAVDCVDKNSAEFRKIPEFARRVVKRHPRPRSGNVPLRNQRVLVLEPHALIRSTITDFLATSASRIEVAAHEPAWVEQLFGANSTFDAVIIGPGLPDHEMLDTVRKLRSLADDVATIILSTSTSSETAVAAFQLGSHDFIHFRDGCLPELVFSLKNAMRRREAEQLNQQLSAELAALNLSLAGQVKERTRDLEAQIKVRESAERLAEGHAARSRSLSMRLLRVQEDERQAIARELHDQVGQLLTGLRFRLEASRADPTALDEALLVNDELLRCVRELTLQLRPRMLDDLGLQPALEWHVGQFQKQTGIAVELDLAMPLMQVAPVLATTVYRVVQEALTNVARHSGSSTAIVTVTADDHSLHVEVSDRGRGFDTVAALAKHNSVGLAGLAERVSLAGGVFELVSRSNQGTRLHAEFPLTSASPHA